MDAREIPSSWFPPVRRRGERGRGVALCPPPGTREAAAMAAERYSVSAFQTLLEKANRLATTAEQHDRDKKLPQAFAQYKQTLQTYLTVIEDMLFTCIHFQERNEDLLREITPNDKYRKPTHPQPDRSKQDVDALDFEGSSNLNRLPGVLSITPDKPVKWSDVVGHETPKFILKLAILDRCPIKHPIMFTGKRQSIKSILLFGPSGCGKSYLTKAMIGAAKDWVCIDVNMASLIRDAATGNGGHVRQVALQGCQAGRVVPGAAPGRPRALQALRKALGRTEAGVLPSLIPS
ncbi:hypothetical protein HPB48_022062 [Haemaphysalis longicornis]|uniref:Uncharacterized protein n=1 Tax=Haemaphysalis longicornis TaxID=44386 RepID=A0A9J6GME0_HAELO|nr:hypothetical protein HPB48_022062 [Haemaphysalis longicornis]